MDEGPALIPSQAPQKVPLFSLAKGIPLQTNPQEMADYYKNRRLTVWNLTIIGISNMGWNVAAKVCTALITLKMLELGLKEDVQGTISSANSVAVSFLVMVFSWYSDHTISRLGRRKPYIFISAPFIIGSLVIFPFIARPNLIWAIILVQAIYLLFMDLKQSTFPLLNIDCVPRDMLGRGQAVFAIADGLVTFFAMSYTDTVAKYAEWLPYTVCGAIMTVTTIVALLIKEPPVYNPRTESFKPWSTFKVAARDKRVFVLFLGVGMVLSYATMAEQWMWLWAADSLKINRADLFDALRWAGLVNVILAMPLGWIIDRFGSLRVVCVYWALSVACCAYAMSVHDKNGLLILSLAHAIVFPMYAAADVMVYKTTDPREIGSITSTNSCLRNFYRGMIVAASTWAISSHGSNYRIGFAMGIVMMTVGVAMFFIHRRLMGKPEAIPVGDAAVPELQAVADH
ncbi:MAG TPA: MFS transporter [Planctomycetota bacterium]|jgi:predicted MFS family arabinose efflux permease